MCVLNLQIQSLLFIEFITFCVFMFRVLCVYYVSGLTKLLNRALAATISHRQMCVCVCVVSKCRRQLLVEYVRACVFVCEHLYTITDAFNFAEMPV